MKRIALNKVSQRVKLAAMTLVDNIPTEFRIFQRGVNRTAKGNFMFDDYAAKAVMSDYRQHGVDLAIDLEHLSLDEDSPAFDPDARGWCKLELRSDGSLWAVSVRWTPDGERRLRERTQRYISPVIDIADNMRVLSLFNLAMCAVPATFDAPELVAASRKHGAKLRAALALEVKMEPLVQIAQKLGLPDTATLEDVMAAIDALNAKAQQTTSDDPPADDAGGDDDGESLSDEIDPEALAKLSPKLQSQILAMSVRSVDTAKRLTALETQTTKSRVDELIKLNAAKLTPKMEVWARKQSPEILEGFFSSAAPVAAERKNEPGRGASSAGSDSAAADAEIEAITLTKEELHTAKLTKQDPVKLLAHKKALAKKKKAKEESING